MKKSVVIIFFVLVVIGILGSLGYDEVVYHVLPYSPIRPHRLTTTEVQTFFPYAANLSKLGLNIETFNVLADDSIPLDGLYIHSAMDTARGTLILLHGIASCKEALLPFADTLAHHGYNCILYDSRAHGKSGGVNFTMGYYERYDVSTINDYARKRFGKIDPIGIFGSSMGASIAIQAMAIDKRVTMRNRGESFLYIA